MTPLTLAAIFDESLWICITIISIWLILMCLKTLGYGYYTAVCWHNLKVQAHNLRLQHQRDLSNLRADTAIKDQRQQKDFNDKLDAQEHAQQAAQPTSQNAEAA